MKQQPIAWILFLSVWFFNIHDLIKGQWFFLSTGQVLFWNFMGVLGFILIVLGYKEELKDVNVLKSEVEEEK